MLSWQICPSRFGGGIGNYVEREARTASRGEEEEGEKKEREREVWN
jgi:hypothetical protein